jgi:flagellar protein FlaG
MDTSAVRASVDVAVYATQVNVAAQSVTMVLPVKTENKVAVAIQPVTASISDKANKQSAELANLHRVTAAMNQFVDALDTDTHIQFKLHQKTNELMVQVVDQKTDKVIREYPTKEFLDTIAAIRTYVGLMLDKKI